MKNQGFLYTETDYPSGKTQFFPYTKKEAFSYIEHLSPTFGSLLTEQNDSMKIKERL